MSQRQGNGSARRWIVAAGLAIAIACGTGWPTGTVLAQAKLAASVDAAKNQRAFLGNLVLLRGRLLTARELYQFAGQRETALRHLGPNLNSRMANIEKGIGKDNAKPLQDAINALDAVAKAGGGFAAFEDAYNTAMGESLKLDGAVTEGRLDQPGFVLATIVDVVEHAAEDYTAAVKDGKVVVPKEYEEVFGYNLAAVRQWQRVIANPQNAQAKGVAAVAEDMALLARAVPSPVPLTALYVTPAQMNKLAAHLKSQIATQ